MVFNEDSNIMTSIIEKPEIIEILERRGIDYYNKANRDFGQVTQDKGFYKEINQSLEENQSYFQMKEVMASDTRSLIRYIKENHHKKEIELLNNIEELMVRVLNAHFTDYENLPEVYKNYMELRSFFHIHLAKEERLEFLSMLRGEEVNISALEEDHLELAALLENLYTSTDNFSPPIDTCPSHIELYQLMDKLYKSIHRHIFLENYILFPKFY